MGQAKFSMLVKPLFPVRLKGLRVLFAAALILIPMATSPQVWATQTPGQTLIFPASIQWPRQRGVTWYRLQIGEDETFRNIYFDRRVMTDQVRISDLAPGYYYWRIAPADNQLGAFSRPIRFFVSGGIVTPTNFRNSDYRRGRYSRPA